MNLRRFAILPLLASTFALSGCGGGNEADISTCDSVIAKQSEINSLVKSINDDTGTEPQETLRQKNRKAQDNMPLALHEAYEDAEDEDLKNLLEDLHEYSYGTFIENTSDMGTLYFLTFDKFLDTCESLGSSTDYIEIR